MPRTPRPLPRRLTRPCALLGLALAAAPAVTMDRIELNDGRVLYGDLATPLASTTGSLKIRMGRTQLLLPRDQVREVGPATPEQATLANGRETLSSGDPGRAILLLQNSAEMAMQPSAMAGELAALLLTHGEDLLAVAHGFNADQTTATRVVLDAAAQVPRGYPRRADLLLISAPLRLVIGDAAGAQADLMRLAPRLLKDDTARQTLAWRVELGVAPLIEAGAFDRVLPIYRQMAIADADYAGGRLTQLALQWAWKERQAGQFEQALDLYIQFVLDDSPEIGRDRIAVTLEEAERTCREGNDLPRAATLYERYGLPHVPDTARQRLVQVRRDQGWQSLRRSEFEAARSAFEQADAVTSGSARVDLLQVQYRERLTAIPKGDKIRHYQLGVWALQNELLPDARREFEAAQDDATVGANARAYIGQIQNSQADQELVRLFGLYEKGDYTEVLQGLYAYMQQDYPLGFLKQAHQLEELTKEALRLRVAERPQQAEALLQRAQRAYYSGQFEEADSLLKLIMTQYSDTVTHQRAKAFYAAVRQRLMLARVEQGRAARAAETATPDAATSTGQASTTGTTAREAAAATPPPHAEDAATSASAPTDGATTAREAELDRLERNARLGATP